MFNVAFYSVNPTTTIFVEIKAILLYSTWLHSVKCNPAIQSQTSASESNFYFEAN